MSHRELVDAATRAIDAVTNDDSVPSDERWESLRFIEKHVDACFVSLEKDDDE